MATGTEGRVYCGVDLHSTNLWVVIIDETGRTVFEQRLGMELSEVLEALGPYREGLEAVAVESTYNWYWLVDGLQEQGYAMKLANPVAMKPYSGLKRTNDRSEARWIAELLRLGILPEGYIYPKAQRPLRDLLRRRLLLVRQRTQSLLSLQSMVMRQCGVRVKKGALLKGEPGDLERWFGDAFSRVAAQSLRKVAWQQEQQVKALEAAALGEMKTTRPFPQLKTLPGVGDVLGLTITLETGPIERFAGPGNYASYSRTVDSYRESNDKKKGENNRKNGNKYLGWAFVEAAQFAQRFDPQVQAWFHRKRDRRCRTVAIKALASKLAKAAYFIMRDGVTYEPMKMFR